MFIFKYIYLILFDIYLQLLLACLLWVYIQCTMCVAFICMGAVYVQCVLMSGLACRRAGGGGGNISERDLK